MSRANRRTRTPTPGGPALLAILALAVAPSLLSACGDGEDHSGPEGAEIVPIKGAPLQIHEDLEVPELGSTPSPEAERIDRSANREVEEQVTGFGAKTVKVPVFECKALRSDPDASDTQFPVPLPPFSEGVFPCTECHDRPDDYNLTKRTLTTKHTEIKLNHGPREQWCYGCHNPTDRDKLRLAGGRLVSFNESYQLCGQCHGTQFRDWRLGIHGRRTGCWNGEREYRLCVHCHSPHAPKFKPLEPRPSPTPPGEIR